jgi:transcription initiation factor TFIID TATA-box-binding protein
MSGLVLPSRANGAAASTSSNGVSNGAAGPSSSAGAVTQAGQQGQGGAAESATDVKGKGVAGAHDEANAIIPGVNGIVPTLQ